MCGMSVILNLAADNVKERQKHFGGVRANERTRRTILQLCTQTTITLYAMNYIYIVTVGCFFFAQHQ